MDNYPVGYSNAGVIAAFIRLDPVAPSDLHTLVTVLGKRIPQAEVWGAPDGVGVLVKSTDEQDFLVLMSLRTELASLDINEGRQVPQPQPVALIESLMLLNYTGTVTQDALQSAQIFVTGAAGRHFECTDKNGFEGLVGRIRTELGATDVVRLQPSRLVSNHKGLRGLWVQSKIQSGSMLRFCRPLPDPTSYTELLGRSVVNAVVGGLGNSLICQELRDNQQLSYNPYSMLSYRGGYQWLIIDVDTSRGYEGDVFQSLHSMMTREIEATMTDARTRHAVRFMLRLQKDVEQRPEQKVRLDLSKVDGSDPFGASFAQRKDFVLDRQTLLGIAHDMFDMNEMTIFAVSQSPEPEWSANKELLVAGRGSDGNLSNVQG